MGMVASSIGEQGMVAVGNVVEPHDGVTNYGSLFETER